ncbi:MAG: exodeoxyribonuclease III [Gammaproteobacteria bacterium]|nr:exodeoxyribonuclease III [Gammaproteobacteria bacterium]
MRVLTFNLNGIRSAARKGFFDWLPTQNADVICLQELKAQEADLVDPIFVPEGYHAHFHYAEKKGYSGVGIYTRHKPLSVKTGLGWREADGEGRYVEVDLGGLTIASLYMPSGTSGDERQTIKFDFLNRYREHLTQQRATNQSFIICGDWNIAHREIDLKNWRSNQKNSGFLPEERAWMDALFGQMGFVDAFRILDNAPDRYTWWSHRGQARAKNVGWRIDYQVITPDLRDKVKHVQIFPEPFFSDHAPFLVEYDI